MKNLRITVDRRIVSHTIDELRQGGQARTERFALWLGRRADNTVQIAESYVPKYEASSDYFHIGRPEMAKLIAYLRERELMIGAQLHTHPAEAFHSTADDRWAIVRHVGALSVVLPYFARATTVENFIRDGKVFALSRDNHWDEIQRLALARYLEITS